ncbi:MAG: hypothetical protein LBQ20_03385, partial [Rhodanobacter sp.]|nr:hypothetical protein [Rhodanobacter sp.]
VPRLGKFEEGLEGGGVVHPGRLTLTLRASTSIPRKYRKNQQRKHEKYFHEPPVVDYYSLTPKLTGAC